MKFHTHQLIHGPVDLNITCKPADVNLNDTDVQFIGDVVATLHLTLVDTGRVLAQGKVRAMMRFDCVRCLDQAMMTLDGELTAIYEATKDPNKEHDPFDDPADHAMIPFNGETLDPAPQIREAIMLAVPDFPICRPDCKGLCLTCGANKNHGPCRCSPTKGFLPDWKNKLLNLSSESDKEAT